MTYCRSLAQTNNPYTPQRIFFVSAELSDDTDVSYEWGCDGGSMTNPQGLFENVWKAPNEAGTYEIWCTVKCGGKKETRRSKMTVLDELFYSNFETPYYNEGWSNASMTVAFDANKGTNGAVKLTSTKADVLPVAGIMYQFLSPRRLQ